MTTESKLFYSTSTVVKLNDIFYRDQRVDPKRNVTGISNTLS